jgi:protein-tyrosine phosphatase
MSEGPYWIDAGPGRRLAILSRPRGGDWLADEVATWKRLGFDTVVSMLTPEENAEFDLTDEPRKSSDAAIEYLSLPIPDRGIPESQRAFDAMAERVRDDLIAGKAVGVHCRAGIGRSALLAGSVLVLLGFSVNDALRRIESARGTGVPETRQQHSWIEQFANQLSLK